MRAISRASPHVGAMGFSQCTAFTLARAQSMVIGAWRCGHVQTLTISGFSVASIFL